MARPVFESASVQGEFRKHVIKMNNSSRQTREPRLFAATRDGQWFNARGCLLLVAVLFALNGCATRGALREGTNAGIDTGVKMAEQSEKMAEAFTLPFRVGQGVSNILRLFSGSRSTNSAAGVARNVESGN